MIPMHFPKSYSQNSQLSTIQTSTPVNDRDNPLIHMLITLKAIKVIHNLPVFHSTACNNQEKNR